MPRIFRPSGGLLYHLRAWRSGRQWGGFSQEIADWLKAWTTPRGRLLLIGPSGGYTLPTEWLKGFDEVIAFDIDPLAPWFFHRRHPGLQARFQIQDLFWHNGHLSLAPLKTELNSRPKSTVLFCNVLGQLPLEGTTTEGQLADYLSSLSNELKGVQWASYHDLFSVSTLPSGLHPDLLKAFRQKANIHAALESLDQPGLEVIDHTLSGEWSRDCKKRILGWSLTPKKLHLIEAVNS